MISHKITSNKIGNTLALLSWLVLMPNSIYASERGTTGAEFLKLGSGAAAAGVGEAGTARSGDMSALYYNPAGLIGLEIGTLMATHLNWIADTQYEVLAYGQPLVGLGTLGASVYWLHMPDIPALDENGIDAGAIKAYDLGLQFSYARELNSWLNVNGLAAGASLKLLHRELADLRASGAALDLGGLYSTGDWRFGLAILNAGYLSSFDSSSEQLPVIVRAGLNYLIKIGAHHEVNALCDLVQPLDNGFRSHLGVEYAFRSTVFLRAGYKIGYDSDGFQAGGGIVWQNVSVDYALKTMSAFGLTHFLSVSLGFGAAVKELKKDRVNIILQQAETLFSQSKYPESLQAVEQAIVVDANNEQALQLRDKLRTVLDLLQLPGTPGDQTQPGAPSNQPKTLDEKEEQNLPQPKEVQP